MWPFVNKAAALVSRWIASCGFNPAMYGTHALRRTKPTLIYNLSSDQEPARYSCCLVWSSCLYGALHVGRQQSPRSPAPGLEHWARFCIVGMGFSNILPLTGEFRHRITTIYSRI
jgi:hypothetical protein